MKIFGWTIERKSAMDKIIEADRLLSGERTVALCMKCGHNFEVGHKQHVQTANGTKMVPFCDEHMPNLLPGDSFNITYQLDATSSNVGRNMLGQFGGKK